MTLLLEVFDPPMCCSTGVCGPSVDPRLPRFAADLDWLRSQGVQVERYNLAQQPKMFADNAEVRSALKTAGVAALPLIRLNHVTVSTGLYPSRDELAEMAGVVPVSVAESVKRVPCCAGSCRN